MSCSSIVTSAMVPLQLHCHLLTRDDREVVSGHRCSCVGECLIAGLLEVKPFSCFFAIERRWREREGHDEERFFTFLVRGDHMVDLIFMPYAEFTK